MGAQVAMALLSEGFFLSRSMVAPPFSFFLEFNLVDVVCQRVGRSMWCVSIVYQ